jgi:triacylglycerol esterase/lipase EstA (alpha/beta hydrolase family)
LKIQYPTFWTPKTHFPIKFFLTKKPKKKKKTPHMPLKPICDTKLGKINPKLQNESILKNFIIPVSVLFFQAR